jgi:hypothetical protein
MTVDDQQCPVISSTGESIDYDCTGTTGNTIKLQADSNKIL